MPAPTLTVLTIGHSTREFPVFLEMLRAHGVTRLVDVRSIPRSRKNPQFNRDTLPAALTAAGIGYTHGAGLGGLRHARADSPNTGWHNASFRGYADYMQTSSFMQALEWLTELAKAEQLVLMCAEAVPWRCHRMLIADALTVRGITVQHIMSKSRADPHRLTPFARIDGLQICYPGDLQA